MDKEIKEKGRRIGRIKPQNKGLVKKGRGGDRTGKKCVVDERLAERRNTTRRQTQEGTCEKHGQIETIQLT